jgi:uncharacterized protein (DUF302 family)
VEFFTAIERRSSMRYGTTKEVSLPFDKAVEKVTEELKKEGFGVLTTIDVKETLKKKLDVDFPRYLILGACNPPFAYKSLQIEEEIGLLLPCNVIVYEKDGKTRVGAFDPMIMSVVIENNDMVPIALEVKARLDRVMAAI